MYEYYKWGNMYYGGNGYGSPIRESQTKEERKKEYDYWDRLEKQIRRQERNNFQDS